MENRGTGLTPNRVPSEWQKSKVDMTSAPKQGPTSTMAPTSRSAGATGFMDVVMRARPSAAFGSQNEQRAQAPIPSQVIDVLAESPGGFIAQHVAGGDFSKEEQHGGGGGNTSESIGKGMI